MAKKQCKICGKEGYLFYSYCKNHLKHNEEHDNTDNNDKCVLCEQPTQKDYLFCRECYKKIKDNRSIFDRNRKEKAIINNYFDIKELLESTKNKNDFEDFIIAIYFLADDLEILYGNPMLINRVSKDIKNAIEKRKLKTTKEQNSEQINDEDFRKKWPTEYRCDDGHYVRSMAELNIDNWLYSNGYIHAYEKQAYMPSDPEQKVISDFYLPNQKIYIEYWGYENNDKYSKRKQIKKNLYKENDYKLLELNKDDIKRLDDIIRPKIDMLTKRNKK